jgi:hypothetical protein
VVGAASFIVEETMCEHSCAFVGWHERSKFPTQMQLEVPLVDALWRDKGRKTGVPVKWSLHAEGETLLGRPFTPQSCLLAVGSGLHCLEAKDSCPGENPGGQVTMWTPQNQATRLMNCCLRRASLQVSSQWDVPLHAIRRGPCRQRSLAGPHCALRPDGPCSFHRV